MGLSAAPYGDPLWLSHPTTRDCYNDSHHRLQKEAREYVDTYISPFCDDWEKQGWVPQDVIQRHAELGYMAVSMYPLASEQISGQRLPGDIAPTAWDGYHDLIIIDEIARCGYLGVIWALSCGNSIGAPPLINFGTREQKQRLLPDVISGRSRFCLGVTEPDAGSDVAGLTTTATRKGDKYIVNGAKKWITNGIFADYCTAAVRTGKAGHGGVSALIIPLKAQGVTVRKMENSGVAASGSTYIEFDDVEVPIANLLGRENEGFEIIMSNFNHERLWLACTSLRMARCCVEDAYAYATKRETFGKKLISNQVIQAKFSSMGRALEPAHAHMEQMVAMLIHGGSAGNDPYLGGLIATLKVNAGRTLEYVVRECQQVLGGAGCSRSGKGARIEQISRDVRVMVVGGGSEEILESLAIKQEMKAVGDKAKL